MCVYVEFPDLCDEDTVLNLRVWDGAVEQVQSVRTKRFISRHTASGASWLCSMTLSHIRFIGCLYCIVLYVSCGACRLTKFLRSFASHPPDLSNFGIECRLGLVRGRMYLVLPATLLRTGYAAYTQSEACSSQLLYRSQRPWLHFWRICIYWVTLLFSISPVKSSYSYCVSANSMRTILTCSYCNVSSILVREISELRFLSMQYPDMYDTLSRSVYHLPAKSELASSRTCCNWNLPVTRGHQL